MHLSKASLFCGLAAFGLTGALADRARADDDVISHLIAPAQDVGSTSADPAATAPIGTAEPAPPAAPPPTDALSVYKRRIETDEQALGRQEQQIAEQRAALDAQQKEIEALKAEVADSLASIRAAGIGALAQASPTPPAAVAPATSPVGEAPPPPQPNAVSLPQGINVLTRPGHAIFETGFDFQNSASNRLVFEGIEIANAFLIGVIQASSTSNDAFIDWNTLYVGVAPRFELDVSMPWVSRHEMFTTLEQANSQLSQSYLLHGSGWGDFEFTGRYQVTPGYPGEPIVIANLRVKTNSGLGPYSVPFNAAGVASELPLGSGFWAVQPSVSVLFPSDPVIIYGNLAYLHSFGYDINKTLSITNLGKARIRQVMPGDGFTASVGFSFSLNQHFSYSLGFRNDYFQPSSTTINTLKSYSLPLEDGSFLVSGSYRLTPHLSLNLNFQFGVTPDAPNTTIEVRLPYSF